MVASDSKNKSQTSTIAINNRKHLYEQYLLELRTSSLDSFVPSVLHGSKEVRAWYAG